MECCRVCLTTNSLSNIFETEEIATNITAIACVDISQDDGLPQYICLLCKHELDISINFKHKCETTFEMLKEQHNKEIEVKENIILNLLSSGRALDEKLPVRARESILNTVKNCIKTAADIREDRIDNKKYFKNNTDKEDNSISEKGSAIWKENIKEARTEVYEEEDETQTGIKSQRMQNDNEVVTMKDVDSHVTATTDVDDQMTAVTDVDDQMTDITETEIEIPELLNIPNQDLMCLRCNFCFMNEGSLFDHLRRMHSKTMGQCQICLLYFPTSEWLKDHLRLKHDISDDNEEIRCKICSKTFGLQSELNAHLCSDSSKNEFWCELCRLNFKSETNLDCHIKQAHQQITVFICDQCNEKFSIYDLYRKHLKDHSELNRNTKMEFVCSECNRTFCSNEEWNNHIMLCHNLKNSRQETKKLSKTAHNSEKSLVCPLCEKCFKTENMLQIHIRRHTGEKSFKCMDSHESFTQASTLTVHRRAHQSIKPHVCSICQMSFYKNTSLEKHLLQHNNLIKCTKEKIYINAEYEEEFQIETTSNNG